MAVRSEIQIDLSRFGQTGVVIMALPSLRKKAMTKNALGNCAKVEVVNGEKVVKETNVGDMEVIELLAFVAKAPFPMDLKSFYDYCDRMDAQNFGSASDMFDAMTEAKEKLISGDMSPFVDSQVQETPSSD